MRGGEGRGGEGSEGSEGGTVKCPNWKRHGGMTFSETLHTSQRRWSKGELSDVAILYTGVFDT